MKILVVAEHDDNGLRLGSLSAIAFARQVAETTGGGVEALLLGHNLDAVATDAARYSATLVADAPVLWPATADCCGALIARVAQARSIDLLVAGSGTFAKDIVTRAAGLLGGAMASDVLGHELVDGRLRMRRAMYAGSVTATVALTGSPQIVTVQPTAYAPAAALPEPAAIVRLEVDESSLPRQIEVEGLQSQATGRPDVTEARIVVSGGRAIKNSEDFERLVGGLADTLGGAAGSSRVLVDAGIAANELQVGQTGKVVAPDVYIALGISGAVQHLAGMKNSKVIVAVNSDADAPIFEVADYGLVGDVYEVVPELIKRFREWAVT